MNLNDVDLNDKTGTLEKMTEGLLNVVKIEIQNLETEIEALNRQKSNLEDILAKYNKIWLAISSKR